MSRTSPNGRLAGVLLAAALTGVATLAQAGLVAWYEISYSEGGSISYTSGSTCNDSAGANSSLTYGNVGKAANANNHPYGSVVPLPVPDYSAIGHPEWGDGASAGFTGSGGESRLIGDSNGVGNELVFTNNFSWWARVYPNSSGSGANRTIVSRFGAQRGMNFSVESGNHLKIWGSQSGGFDSTFGTATSSGTVALDRWNDVGFTFQNGNVSFYLNGQLDSTTTFASKDNASVTVPSVHAGMPLRISRRPDGAEMFYGGIEQVRLYDTVEPSPTFANLTPPQHLQAAAWYRIPLEEGTATDYPTGSVMNDYVGANSSLIYYSTQKGTRTLLPASVPNGVPDYTAIGRPEWGDGAAAGITGASPPAELRWMGESNGVADELVTTNDFSWWARIYPQAAGNGANRTILSRFSTSGGQRGMQFYLQGDNRLRVHGSQTGNYDSTFGVAISDGALTLDQWHDVGFTFENGVVKFYIDGQLDGTKNFVSKDDPTVTVTSVHAGHPLRVGRRGENTVDNELFHGGIEQVFLYNTVQPASTFQQLTPRIAHFPLNEASFSSGATVSDIVPPASTGTTVGAVGRTTYGVPNYPNTDWGDGVAATFSGGHIDCGNGHHDELVLTNNFTAWARIRVDQFANQIPGVDSFPVISRFNAGAGNSRGFNFGLSSTGKLSLFGQRESGSYNNTMFGEVVSNAAISAGQWQDIAITFQDGLVSFYIDGMLDSTKELRSYVGSNLIPYFAPGTGLWVGRRPDMASNYVLYGAVEQFRTWDAVLTEEQLLTLTTPEPTTLVLFGGLLAGAALRRRRRRKAASRATMLVALAALVALGSGAALAGPITVFQDDFEDQLAVTGTYPTATLDPNPPPVGQPWQISETVATSVAVVHFPSDLTNAYLVHNKNADNTAMAPLSFVNQGLVAAHKNVTLEFDYRAYTDGGNVPQFEIAGYNSNAFSDASAAVFRIRTGQGGSSDVLYYNPGTGTFVDTGVNMPLAAFRPIKVEADFAAQTYDIDINGSIVTGLPFATSQAKIRNVQLSGFASTGSRTNTDNIEVTVQPNYGRVIFQDDFQDQLAVAESYPSGTLDPNAPPIGDAWVIDEGAGNGVILVTDITDPTNACLAINKNAANTAIAPFSVGDQNWIESQGNLTVDFDVRGYTSGGFPPFEVGGYNSPAARDNANAAFVLRADQASPYKLLYYDPTSSSFLGTGINFTAQAFQPMSIVADFDAQTYDVFLHGQSVTGLPFASTQGTIQNVQFTSYAGVGSVMNLDNILVTTTVPEPATMALVGAGLLALVRRRKRQA